MPLCATYLVTFDGLNPHSVVIMDNASIHHVEWVHDIVTIVLVLALYFYCHIAQI